MVRDKIDGNFLYFFDQGECYNAYDIFGAHVVKDAKGNIVGCEFCLFAPNARRVEIVAEWNGFFPNSQELYCIDEKGIWYAYLEGNLEWGRYKYLITTHQGEQIYKADPYAFYADLRPSQDSKVYDIDGYEWHDQKWMKNHEVTYEKPLLIYELHMGSWRRKPDNSFNMFTDIAPMLIDYLKDFGYTHVEVMPIYEHPLDMSWGYQGTGYYAVSSRYGVPKDFMWFVDQLHQAGIGVIMDWVPGHICRDGHGLYRFDGSFLYEYEKAEDRENYEWGTANLDLGKGITRSFLYSNAMFYMNYFHVDGFRIDAVSNIVYWMGNVHKGTNEGACDFLRNLSRLLFAKDDRVLLMAEDSSAFDGVTRPVDMGGLGFNYKWDMGWMNDTLKYFKKDPIYRKYHHHMLTFSMVYNHHEQFCLPLSHDEVVHMKGSLLNKMPGDEWQKFANFRTLIAYMMTHPGKKLLFMGNELASYDEWHYEKELPWNILQFPNHDASCRFVKELTMMYKNEPALWEQDFRDEGFRWIDADNADQSLYSYIRYAKDPKNHLLVVMNCTPNTYDNYRMACEDAVEYVEIMNTDRDIYGGSNRINPFPLKVENVWQYGREHSIMMTIPPLGVSILKAVYPKETKKAAPKAKKTAAPKEKKEETKVEKKASPKAKKTTTAKKSTTTTKKATKVA
ncbi:MAG: 1,4-alpha-glucan branching protein GlgB [Acholeplasmatales bacterium]|nr:1,4-alpha-glucan branching protein GlgB [Acholeplasmatales bacterium]